MSTLEKWDKAEIENRFDIIADRFLKIWKIPDIELEDGIDGSELNIFEAEDPTHRKLEYAVFFDQKIETNQVAKLYVEVIKELFELQPETFFTTELGTRIGLTKNPEESNTRQAAAINDTYFIEANIDSLGKFDRIKQALTIFDIEDELTIKFEAN